MAIKFKILSDSINSILFLKKYHIIESIIKQKITYIQKCLAIKFKKYIIGLFNYENKTNEIPLIKKCK